MTITLPPETETTLREQANREGLDVDTFANALLVEALEQKARDYAEAVRAIQEGLDAVQQGRERPFEEFLAEHQARYGVAGPGTK